MSEEKHKSRAWVWWTLLALLVLYPLSVGPAVWVCRYLGISSDWLDTVYWPVLRITQMYEPLDRAYIDYFKRWL